MGLINKLKKIYKLLKTNEFEPLVTESKTLEQTQFLYNLLYRSKASEKIDYYSYVNDGCEKFWGEVKKHKIPCKCASAPSDTINVLTNIIEKNLNEILIDDNGLQEEFNNLNKNNTFKKLIVNGTKNGLIYGDSVFTVDILKDKTVYLDLYAGNLVDIKEDAIGNITKIIAYKEFFENDKCYKLKSIYTKGRNYKELYKDNKRINFYSVDYTKNLLEDYIFNKEILTGILYTPLGKSGLFKERGKSIFENKEDAVDFLDEVFSIWNAAIRKSLPISYLPVNSIPISKEGQPLKPNSFSHIFIQSNGPMPENSSGNKIEFTQANIQINAYEKSMSQAIAEFCEGIISPSTLAISDKKYRDANASYTQELEKQTITTINAIFENLTNSAKSFISIYLSIKTGTYKENIEELITIKYSSYGTPSLESKIDIVNKAKDIMSLEEKIEFLYGDDRSENWKKEEIERIRGINKKNNEDKQEEMKAEI